MILDSIKYSSSIAGYLFKVYLLCIACAPAIVILFFDKFNTVANDLGYFIIEYVIAFTLGASLSLPALILTLICGFVIFIKVRDIVVVKGILLFVFIFLILVTFKLSSEVFFDSITRSTEYQMTFVFLYIIASFAYKLERKQN